jgi:hypothetical protein
LKKKGNVVVMNLPHIRMTHRKLHHVLDVLFKNESLGRALNDVLKIYQDGGVERFQKLRDNVRLSVDRLFIVSDPLVELFGIGSL